MAIAIVILVLIVFGLSFLCANLYAYWKKGRTDLTATQQALKESQEFSSATQSDLTATQQALKESQEFSSATQSDLTATQQALKEWEVIGRAATEENEILSKYRDIPNVEKHLADLEKEATAKRLDIEAIIKKEQEQHAARLKSEETEHANLLTQKVIEADKRVEIAERTLERIELARKQKEELLTAMKNIVEGYGNEYLVPKDSILDQLAEEYGYDKAARNLKEARNRTRDLVRKGLAVASGLIDPQQNEAAKDFLVDAFNGRVDAVLEKVKTEGYGVLKRMAKDIYEVVNESGRCFSNTQITEDYLQSRQEEIKWAVKVFDIREKEREEQRILKEQQRDEALAQKEIEKAQKEAQEKIEDDERIRKLAHEEAEKVRRDLATAKDSERTALMERLKEAEERAEAAEEQVRLSEEEKERAKSLAQQTKRGKVYIISNVGSFGEGVFKIGMTRRIDHEERIKELGDASVPFEFDVHAIIQSDNVPELEKNLHRNLTFHRVNKSNWRKEFFKVPLEKLRKIIEEEGHETEWTLKARALQWRETQEIEKRIEEDKNFKEQWASRQAKLIL